MSAPFHQTRMGQRFFEHTVPELVRQLTRLNDLIGRGVAEPAAAPAPRRFVVTMVPDGDDAREWFVVDRQDEEPAILVGVGPENRRRAGEIARELEEEHG